MEIALADLPDRYAFCDLASSKKPGESLKKIRARSAIVVVAPDWLGRVFVLDAWAARCSTEELIERMYKVHETWKLKALGCEANAMQELFAEAVMRDARLRGKALPVRPVHQPTRIEKDWRIRTILQPIIANGRLFVQADMTPLKIEIGNFPTSPIKDLVDALASAIKLIPPRQTMKEKDEELDHLVSYLRKTGAPASYIEEVVKRKTAHGPRTRIA